MRVVRGVIGVVLIAGTSVGPLLAQRSPSAVEAGERAIVHVLNRIAFGPSPADIEYVRRVGVARYIDEQVQPGSVPDDGIAGRLAGFGTLTMSSNRLAEEYFEPAERARRARQAAAGSEPEMAPPPPPADRQVLVELTAQKLLRAAYSRRQLEEVLVDFWFNHFNVFAGKGATRIYLTEYERDVIRPRVLGRFRDLLGAVAASPAMLFYLDNWQSAVPNPAGRGGINENYARELMELHSLGVDGGYTQADVREVARAFTGWTIDRPRAGGPFLFRPRLHDEGDKRVLGQRIAAGGRRDGEQVLDLLAAHPSTARFIATKLARRFVADDPPAALVERAAARFRETGGDIREVVRAIVTSPEFGAPAAYRAKVKNPFEFVVSSVRATGVDVRGAGPLVQAVRQLGMPLYGCQPPTGYADTASAWVNSGALLARMNFAVMLSGGGMRIARPTADGAAMRDGLIAGALGGDLSAATRDTVAKAERPAQAVALLLGSPEFQKK